MITTKRFHEKFSCECKVWVLPRNKIDIFFQKFVKVKTSVTKSKCTNCEEVF